MVDMYLFLDGYLPQFLWTHRATSGKGGAHPLTGPSQTSQGALPDYSDWPSLGASPGRAGMSPEGRSSGRHTEKGTGHWAGNRCDVGLDTQMSRLSTFWGSTGSGVVGHSWHWNKHPRQGRGSRMCFWTPVLGARVRRAWSRMSKLKAGAWPQRAATRPN